MTKFIIKCLIILFIFMLGVTYNSSGSEDKYTDQLEFVDMTHVLTSQKELYIDTEADHALPLIEKEVDTSFTYQLAQFIEQSGLMIYEGLIKVITDIASVV